MEMSNIGRRGFLSASAFAAGSILAGGSASAILRPAPLNAWDNRTDFEAGRKVRVEIWYNRNGWMLRVTSKLHEFHRFNGRIQVIGGTFSEVSAVSVDTRDRWNLNRMRDNLSFDFTNNGGEDGLNFRCSRSAVTIVVTLHIDGREVPEIIRVGRDTHPASIPFTLPAHPRP